jgi:hypothetical protein
VQPTRCNQVWEGKGHPSAQQPPLPISLFYDLFYEREAWWLLRCHGNPPSTNSWQFNLGLVTLTQEQSWGQCSSQGLGSVVPRDASFLCSSFPGAHTCWGHEGTMGAMEGPGQTGD